MEKSQQECTARTELIISLFKEGLGDAKTIASQSGFANHREMAAYLKTNGYLWNRKEGNYVSATKESRQEQTEVINWSRKTVKLNKGRDIRELNHSTLDQYLPLLKFLAKHQRELAALLTPNPDNAQLPRYQLKNNLKTKSINIASPLEYLVGKLAEEENISPQEIVEAALVEFLQKYRYGEKINKLLKE